MDLAKKTKTQKSQDLPKQKWCVFHFSWWMRESPRVFIESKRGTMHFAAWLCVKPKDVEDAVRGILPPQQTGRKPKRTVGLRGWEIFPS